jgi:hypothetical protein
VADKGCSIHLPPINGMRGWCPDKSISAAAGIDGKTRVISSAFPASYRGASAMPQLGVILQNPGPGKIAPRRHGRVPVPNWPLRAGGGNL